MSALEEPKVAPAAEIDLDDRDLYFNRELSWLEFNQRVLELAEDADIPLLERLKFVAITANNLDEFFMVRVAGLHDQVDAGIATPLQDGRTPSETLIAIRGRVAEHMERMARVLDGDIRPALAENGISIVHIDDVSADERERLDERFRRQIFPVLTPLAVGLGRPFPYISNLSLSLGVVVHDPVSHSQVFARVKVPTEMLPRFVPLADGRTFVPLEELIAKHLDQLFPGMEIVDTAVFRVTRDADFTVSDEADDLLQAVEDELRRRRFGEVVRVEVESSMSREMREQLERALEAEHEDVFAIDGLLDLNDLMEIGKIPGYKELRDPPWTPLTQPALLARESEDPNVMAAMREGDILLHHPYDSFSSSVERLVEEAVNDPDVLAIKQTVYRTSDDSPLVPALIRAAERGKQAVCLVELKARFDERANITWARAMEEAGVHVVYGLPSLKTHAKCILIVRREGDGVRNYVHVGTGNYHPKTARLYTDFGLLTCDDRIGADVADMFNFLTGFARPRRYRQVLVAPAHLRDGILAEIERTIEAKQRGQARPHRAEDELAGRPPLHPRALRRLAGRRAGGPQHPRHLLPAAGRPGRVGEHPRRLDRRALPRALPDLRLRARQDPAGLHRLRGPDAAQPRHAGGAARPGAGPRPARRPARHAGALLRRRHQLVGAGRGRQLDAPHAAGPGAPQRAARADAGARGARP